jgi:hypothetical protein
LSESPTGGAEALHHLAERAGAVLELRDEHRLLLATHNGPGLGWRFWFGTFGLPTGLVSARKPG